MKKMSFVISVMLAAMVAIVPASQNSTSVPTTGTVTGLQMAQAINEAVDTVATMESGTTNPGAIGAYRLWADTANGLLKQRNAPNSAWVTIAPLLQTLAPINSPALTGTPTAPTVGNGSNTTQIATTAFVQNTLSTGIAMRASTLAQNGGGGAPMTFNWAGQSGQPSWLWGSNDGTNVYVWNPSNFSVNYANSAGSATTATNATNATNASNATGTLASQTIKAWVNFNGTSSGTITPRDNFNISSVTKNGTGDYTLNFTSALPNANYAIVGTSSSDAADTINSFVFAKGNVAPTTTSRRITVANASGTKVDVPYVHIIVISN